jgi:chaperone required for assembly of F1-ATPase
MFSIVEKEGYYYVCHNKSYVQTPGKRVVGLKGKNLALRFLEDYRNTLEFKKKPTHLMIYVFTAFDRIESHQDKIIDSLKQILMTDTALMWDSHFSKLFHFQSEELGNFIAAFNQKFLVDLEPHYGLSLIQIKETTWQALEDFLKSLDVVSFSALYFMTNHLFSLVLALGVVTHMISFERALELAFLEEKVQQEKWGVMEEHKEHLDWLSDEMQTLLFLYEEGSKQSQ